jgi:hypothetical protein
MGLLYVPLPLSDTQTSFLESFNNCKDIFWAKELMHNKKDIGISNRG